MTLEQALKLAEEKKLDLVEVAANADPSVWRIMNYGKFRYEQTKKEKTAKKHQHSMKIKEIKLHPNIDPHDLEIKEKQTRKFLEHGYKVKVTVVFKGRQIDHIEFGKKVLDDLVKSVEDLGVMEMRPKMLARNMTTVIGPLKSPHQAK